MSDQHTNLPTNPLPSDWSPHDDLPAYALGLLDADEQTVFEAHLKECTECQAELAAQSELAGLLPRSLTPVEPPAGARERLLARARAEAMAPASAGGAPTLAAPATSEIASPDVGAAVRPVPNASATAADPPTRLPQRRRSSGMRLSTLSWAAALLFVLASGVLFGTWNATGPHASPTIEILARLPGGYVMQLAGTGVPTASARLYVSPDSQRAELVVDQLPQLAAGRTYQLWFAEPGQPIKTGGVFAVDPRGDAVARVTIPAALDRMRAIAVTEEAAPGSPSPTGPHLLDWTP